MTILIALKLRDGVLITADKKSSDINFDGSNKGTFKSVEKITYLHPKMIIATAGLGGLGGNLSRLLNSIFGIKEELNVGQAILHISELFRFTHTTFKAANPEITYTDLVAFIGGYDHQSNSSYLYSISSADNFVPIKHEGNFIVVGPNMDKIKKDIGENINNCRSLTDYVTLFSKSIRETDSEEVSKETFSIVSFYDSGYKVGRLHTDSEGAIVNN